MAKTFDGLSPGFRSQLEAMIAASGGRLTLRSGARSRDEQERLWKQALAKYGDPEIADNWAARPGTSNHEDGEAADIGGDLAWAHQNAHRFGLHFPMSWEKWHVEPISKSGKKAAAYTKPPMEGMVAGPEDTERRSVGFQVGALMDLVYQHNPTRNPLHHNVIGEARSGSQAKAEALQRTGKDPAKVAQTAGGIGAFLGAMSGQESGGNYNARNKRTGAAGRFQIMPGNWGPWAQEAGLGRNAARTPENQDRVAEFKMNQYHQQFGSWEAVAVAWYAGPDDAAIWVKDPGNRRFDRKPGKNEPTIREYVRDVMARMG